MSRVFAFNQKSTAEALDRFVAMGHIHPVGESSQAGRDPVWPATRIWMAIVKTEITAATGGDISLTPGDEYTVGTGEVYLLQYEDGALVPFTELVSPPDVTWVTRTVYSTYPFPIPVDEGAPLPVIQDRKGDLWVLYTPGLKENCWATFDDDFTTGSQTVAGTIQNQWGAGVDHGDTAIVLYNHPTDVSGTYIFSGSSGGWCTAQWRGESNEWNIIIPQCP